MIKTISIIILVLSILDLSATYLYISNFHKKFPQLDHIALEANPILRTAMRHFGIAKGIIYGGVVVFLILLLIVLTSTEKWLYYLCGALSMMLIYHFLNFSQLAALKGVGS